MITVNAAKLIRAGLATAGLISFNKIFNLIIDFILILLIL